MYSESETFPTFAVEAVSKKFYAPGIGYYRFLPVHFEEQFILNVRDDVFQSLFRTCFTSAEYDHIVGVADKFMSSFL